jgi:hypothetical protein
MADGSDSNHWRGSGDDDEGDPEPTAVTFRRDPMLWLIFAQPDDPGSLTLSCFGAWRLWSDGLTDLCIVRRDGVVDVALEDPLFLGVEERRSQETPYQAMVRLDVRHWRELAHRTVSKAVPTRTDLPQ